MRRSASRQGGKSSPAPGGAAQPKTRDDYWDEGYGAIPSARFRSPFDPFPADMYRLLARSIGKGERFLELGCAPGKTLAWIRTHVGAEVVGIDYSRQGIGVARRYFETLHLDGDLRHEDLFSSALPAASFDCVFSAGLIEHFDAPDAVVKRHVELARPGGRIVILVPNYGGVWGRAQARLDPANLAIHNVAIMTPPAMLALADPKMVTDAKSFYFGRPSLWGISLQHLFPAALARAVQRASGLAANLLPVRPGAIAPAIALTMTRKG